MKKTKALQYFSDAYLKSLRGVKAEHILRFLDEFRRVHACKREHH